MSSPANAILQGSFTSDGSALNLALPSGYSKFEMINITDIGSTAVNTNVMKAFGTSSMAAGSAYYTPKTSGAATNDPEVTTASNGFTFILDSADLALGSLVALNGTEINRAAPAVANSGTTTGLIDSSSVVRLYGTTGMYQVSGMDFTVGTIVASTSFQLKYLDNSGFAADATAGAYRIINSASRFYPKSRYITSISLAASAVVVMSVTHGLSVGQQVRFIVPDAFGMSEINGLSGTITAINTSTNSITVNINSSGFTAFAFPTSAIAASGFTFAQVVPVGEAAIAPYQNLLSDATLNQSFTGVKIGTAVQTTAKVYQWIAYKGLSL